MPLFGICVPRGVANSLQLDIQPLIDESTKDLDVLVGGL